jgi:hypothetical protein
MKITDHFRGTCRIHPNFIMENRRMSTWNRLDLQTLGFQTTMPKKVPDDWLEGWLSSESFEPQLIKSLSTPNIKLLESPSSSSQLLSKSTSYNRSYVLLSKHQQESPISQCPLNYSSRFSSYFPQNLILYLEPTSKIVDIRFEQTCLV